MDLHGLPWTSMDLHGLPWTSMDFHGPPWTSMDFHGLPWTSMDLHGPPWTSMDFHGLPWISMDLHGIPGSPWNPSKVERKSTENLRSRIDRKIENPIIPSPSYSRQFLPDLTPPPNSSSLRASKPRVASAGIAKRNQLGQPVGVREKMSHSVHDADRQRKKVLDVFIGTTYV